MASKYDGKVIVEITDKGATLRRNDNPPKGVTAFSNANINALLEALKAAKLAFAPYAAFIPGLSPTTGGAKAHSVAEVEKAIKAGNVPVLLYGKFGQAQLAVLPPRAQPAGRKSSKRYL